MHQKQVSLTIKEAASCGTVSGRLVDAAYYCLCVPCIFPAGSPRVPYSHEEWEELLCGKLFGLRDQNTPAVLAKILEADVQHPHVIADMDITELEQLLGDQVPADVAHWFHDLCSLYAGKGQAASLQSDLYISTTVDHQQYLISPTRSVDSRCVCQVNKSTKSILQVRRHEIRHLYTVQ